MYKENMNYENQQRMIFDMVNEFGIPEIQPTKYETCEFIGFNQAKTCKDRAGKGVHFFLDDYQFQRLWNRPDAYINMLSQFRFIMSPDFSTYTDFPKALQIYNHFRKHWIGAYMQMYGIDVIPTISWSDRKSFEWCFDGEPVGGAVAISSVGVMNSKERKALFIDGYNLHFTMDDNLSLSEAIKKRYRSMYVGVFFKRYILGLWCVAEGLVYQMFDEEKHVHMNT